MKILEAQNAMLSNYEVYRFINTIPIKTQSQVKDTAKYGENDVDKWKTRPQNLLDVRNNVSVDSVSAIAACSNAFHSSSRT